MSRFAVTTVARFTDGSTTSTDNTEVVESIDLADHVALVSVLLSRTLLGAHGDTVMCDAIVVTIEPAP